MQSTNTKPSIELRQLLNQRLPALRLSPEQISELIELSGHTLSNVLQAANCVVSDLKNKNCIYKPSDLFDKLKWHTHNHSRKYSEIKLHRLSAAQPHKALTPLTPDTFVEVRRASTT